MLITLRFGSREWQAQASYMVQFNGWVVRLAAFENSGTYILYGNGETLSESVSDLRKNMIKYMPEVAKYD